MALPSRTAVQLAGARVSMEVLRSAVQVRPRAGKSAAQRQQRIHDFENNAPSPTTWESFPKTPRCCSTPPRRPLLRGAAPALRRCRDRVLLPGPDHSRPVTRSIGVDLPAEVLVRAPYCLPGRGKLQPILTRPTGRIHLAGDYLGTLCSETAIASGMAAATTEEGQLD